MSEFRYSDPKARKAYNEQFQQLDKPAQLAETKSLRDLLSDLRKAEAWLLMAAFAAFLASSFFVVKYFVGGDMHPTTWTGEQWTNAMLGLGITAVITAAQAFLYASGYKGPAAVMATVIVVFFGLFSEISQSMERGDEIVKVRSTTSEVYKKALGSIDRISAQSTAPITNPYAAQIAEAEQDVARCQKKLAAGKTKYCDGDIALLNSLKSQGESAMSTSASTASSALSGAISQAKALEFDEDKQYAIIRMIKQLFGATPVIASFLFSVIIIGTFEYAFHFVGGYVADHKRALLMMGRDPQGNPIDDLPPDGSDPTGKTRNRPAPSTNATSTSNLTGSSSTGATAKAEHAEWNDPAIQQQIDDLRNTRQQAKSLLEKSRELPTGVSDLTAERQKRRPTPTAETTQKLTGSDLTVSPEQAYSKPAPTSKPTPVSQTTSKPSPQDNAIASLWSAIDHSKLKRVSFPQCKNRLKLDNVTQDNDQAQQLTAIALDALEREGVVMINPKYDASNPRGGFDKYILRRDYARQPNRWSKSAGEATA